MMKSLFMLFPFCIYLFFFYHLLLIPALAQYSFYGLLVIPFILVTFWLIPKENRKQAVIFTFLFFLLDGALANALNKMTIIPFILSVLFIAMFLYPMARWYGRIKFSAFLPAFLVALIFNLIFPSNLVQVFPHFWVKWGSDKLYIGDMSSDFPIHLQDIDGDGADEMITIGNSDYIEQLKESGELPEPTYQIKEDPLSLFVWKWQDGAMVRQSPDGIDTEKLLNEFSREYIGFPYYTLSENLELIPLVQRQPLTEGMMQFGTAPYRALLLNIENIQKQLEQMNGYYDYKETLGTKFEQVSLKAGSLKGTYEGIPFEVSSPATKIIGSIRLGDNKEGLLIIGRNLYLLQMVNSKFVVTHELTREMQKGLALSKIQLIDLEQDGKDEIMIKHPYSTILSPQEDGNWKILWSTDERSFRFEDFYNEGGQSELIGLSKSAVRATDTNYLTGFKLVQNGEQNSLVQNWKVFLSMGNAQLGDINGDGHKELIVTKKGQHQIFVLEKHSIPVTSILIGLTILLILYLAGRRIQHAKNAS